jgi:hypothetical protein
MKRILALVALTTALAGCQSMQRELFGPPGTTTTTTRTTPISSAPVGPPGSTQTPSGFTYTPAAGQTPYTTTQPSYTTPSYTAPTYTTAQAQPLFASRPADTVGQRALLDADRNLSDLVAQRGLAAAVSSLADPEGTTLVSTNTAGSLNLIPERATLSSSQDFGQTSGRFVQVLANRSAVQGRYITVWRRNGSEWRVLSFASTSTPVSTATTVAPARRR